MKLPTDPRLPLVSSNDEYLKQLNWKLTDLLRQHANQMNNLSDGFVTATNAYTSPPTTAQHLQGDIVRNSAPTELGAALSKYVITQWICTVSGTPGAWLECRSLTGN